MSKKRPARKRKSRAPGWRTIMVLSGLLVLAAGGLSAYKQNWEITHDLSVIGNGTPTIVQIHDPSCRLCRSLKANTERALTGIDEPIQYRIADIHTPEGRSLQNQHRVPHVTLLLFKPDGTLDRTLTGVKSVDTLRHVFERFVARRSRSS